MDELFMALGAGAAAGFMLALAIRENSFARLRETVARQQARIASVGSLFEWLISLDARTRGAIEFLRERPDADHTARAIEDRAAARSMDERMAMWVTKPNDLEGKWEDQCTKLLAANLHILFPEFQRVSDVHLDREIGTFLKSKVHDIAARVQLYEKFAPSPSGRPDLLAEVRMRTRLAWCSDRAPDAAYFLVEAKRPDKPVDHFTVNEALGYAYDLWKLLAPGVEGRTVHFECLAVGGTIAKNAPIQTMVEISQSASVRVTAVTWNELRERFRAVTRLSASLPLPIYSLGGTDPGRAS